VNKQQKIKEYFDYGFTPEQIAKEMDLPIFLVNTALKGWKKPIIAHPAKSITHKKHFYDWRQGMDREMPMYEMLYEYGALKINKYVRVYGIINAAELMRYDRKYIWALKKHFGYYNSIPKNALEKINYFSTAIKREVDARDGRKCVRCGKDCSYEQIRYHKISHPGPMNANNCATVCKICRTWRIRKHYDLNPEIFKDMDYAGFVEWIRQNDPPYARMKREKYSGKSK
jgi:hypothetical protein